MAAWGLLSIHGMGRVEGADEFEERIRSNLLPRLTDISGVQPPYEPIEYASIMEGIEGELWDRMTDEARGGARLDWQVIRKFFLYWFSDATTYQRTQVYPKLQERIKDSIDALRAQLDSDDAPIVIVGHSLGCQILCDYIWDVRKRIDHGEVPAEKSYWSGQEPTSFQALGTARALISTGCNIPLFVSGVSPVSLFSRPHPRFQWLNIFDRDDVLGWPLKALGDAYLNADWISDVQVNAGMTPNSHSNYWKRDEVLNRAATAISRGV
jgi:hypothetical protein